MKIEALEQEKTDLLQKIQTSQEDLKAVCKEKDSLKILVEDLQAERDTLNSTMHGLYKTIEKTVAAVSNEIRIFFNNPILTLDGKKGGND